MPRSISRLTSSLPDQRLDEIGGKHSGKPERDTVTGHQGDLWRGGCPSQGQVATCPYKSSNSRSSLIVRVLFIKRPARRIPPNVFPDTVQVFVVPDDVIVKRTLPLEEGEAAFAYPFR